MLDSLVKIVKIIAVRTIWTIFAIFSISTSVLLAAGEWPGVISLMIWPSARSAALGGAMTGLADDADAAFWNPGGLGFQKGWGFSGTFNNYLPGLAPQGVNFYYFYGSVGYSFPDLFKNKMIVNIGINNTYNITGRYEVVNADGDYLEFKSYDEALGIHSGVRLSDKVGFGLGLKYVHSVLPIPQDWFDPLNFGGETGSTFSFDLGLLYKPFNFLSTGLALANLGPLISYSYSGSSDFLPRMLRIGLCYTPVDNEFIRLRILPEMNKILVGMFYDPYDTISFGQELSYEWKEAWKSLGIEATIIKILSLRLGYFEDLFGARGGIRVIKNDREEYLSLFEYIFSRNRGKLDRVGLTFGFGINFKDYLRFDISSDHLIWDFPTSNLKFSLTSNNLGELIKKVF